MLVFYHHRHILLDRKIWNDVIKKKWELDWFEYIIMECSAVDLEEGAKKAKRSAGSGAELQNLLKKPLVMGGVLALSAAIGIALLRLCGKRR